MLYFSRILMEVEKPESTGAARIKKMRNRLKENDRDGYLEKERKRINEIRKKQRQNMTDKEKEEKKSMKGTENDSTELPN